MKKDKFTRKVATVMHEFGKKELHAGKTGKKVTSPKQAIAIALSEGRRVVGPKKQMNQAGEGRK